jgi:hypothetical protein
MRLVVGLAALALLAAASLPASAADLAAVKARGSLRVIAVDLRQPDEFFQFSGAPGFDREILEGFAKLHELRLEPVAVAGWDDLVPVLLEGRGDVIAGRFTVTEERKKRIAFTQETFPTRNVVLTRQPTPPARSLAELRALRVGTIRGSACATATRRCAPRSTATSRTSAGPRPGAGWRSSTSATTRPRCCARRAPSSGPAGASRRCFRSDQACQTAPPGYSWAASDASFISIE